MGMRRAVVIASATLLASFLMAVAVIWRMLIDHLGPFPWPTS